MAFLNDLTLQQIVTRAIAFLVFASLHGALLAFALRWAGSLGPAREGRLTANPVSHLAIWGLFMAVLFRAGWLRPIRVDATETYRSRLVLVAVGTSVVTLLLVPCADLFRIPVTRMLTGTAGHFLQIVLDQIQEVTLGSVILGLAPLPILTGRLFLLAAMPGASRRVAMLEGPTTFVLVAAMIAVFDPAWIEGLLPHLTLTR